MIEMAATHKVNISLDLRKKKDQRRPSFGGSYPVLVEKLFVNWRDRWVWVHIDPNFRQELG
jgi:hypothetical protein